MDASGATQAQRRSSTNIRRRIFTLEHANRALPLVKRIVTDIVKQYKVVSSLEEECHDPHTRSEVEALDELRDRYADELFRLRELAEELTSIGCELKDWRRGLVDFPARYEDRDVYFCWRLGEEVVTHWHELDSGFQGRRRVAEAVPPIA